MILIVYMALLIDITGKLFPTELQRRGYTAVHEIRYNEKEKQDFDRRYPYRGHTGRYLPICAF
jgi:hypothetical protein